MTTVLSLLDQLRSVLAGATTLRGRIVVSTLVVLFSLVVGALVAPYLVRRSRELIEDHLLDGELEGWLDDVRTHVDLGFRLDHAVRASQGVVLLLTGIALLLVWGLTDIARQSLSLAVGAVPYLVDAGLTVGLVVAAYVATGLLGEFLDSLSQDRDTLDEHQAEIVFRVLQVAVIGLVVIVGLTLWGVDLGGLLVGAGFLGIVVGMAARQTLGSVLAGFVLMFSKPFEVGDWIEVDGREGIVTDITIVNTRLENFDGEYVVIPNDVVETSTVVNRTRKGRLRIRLEVGVDYSVEPERAEEVAMAAMKEVDEVMPVPRPQVVPTGFADSAIVLELRFWIDSPSARRKWRAKAAVLRSVYAAFESAGIKIPYPQRELSGRQETGGFRVADRPVERNREPGAEAPTRPEAGVTSEE